MERPVGKARVYKNKKRSKEAQKYREKIGAFLVSAFEIHHLKLYYSSSQRRGFITSRMTKGQISRSFIEP